MTDPRPDKSRYRLIEAARGIASLWVLFFHSLINYPPASLPGLLRLAREPARYGWLGVQVFFALSGWCIAERIAKARTRAEPSPHFLLERFLRIYPTYWAALAASILIALLCAPLRHVPAAGDLPRHFAGWLGAALLIEPYLGIGHTYVPVSWTLVYEFGFYLCAAGALVAAQMGLIRGRGIFLIGAALCFAPWTFQSGSAPWLMLPYWPNFFAGAAAWWAVRRGRRWAGYGLLGAMSAAALVSPAYGDAPRWTALLTAWALGGLYAFDLRLASAWPVRRLVWVGGFSYSLYLIHGPLLTRLLNLSNRVMPSSSPLFLGWWLASVVAAIAGGWILHRCVEAPVERWRKTVTLFQHAPR